MKAVIFDLDGTLLDVREGMYWQFEELSRHFDGTPVSREAIANAAHGSTEQIVRSLISNTNVPFDDILKHHQKLRLQSYDNLLKLYEGVDELLPILRRMDVSIAAVTAGNQLTLDCLERTGVRGHFNALVDATRVTRTKPDPEGILLALREMNIKPEDAIMVGDTVADILAGKNAGLGMTVGVTHGFGHVDALRAAGADRIINDIPSLLDVIE